MLNFSSKLKNAIELSSRLTVYIPSTININEEIDKIATLLSGYFGGATSTEAAGYWLSDTAGLIKEKSVLVFAYCSEAHLKKYIDNVVEACEELKRELNQEAIALELNGKMYFI